MNNKLEIVYVKIEDLKPAEYNPRGMSAKEARDLELSLSEFGLVEPIVVNSAPERFNIIIGGHQRYFLEKKRGSEELPVVYVNIPEVEREQELNARLNKNLGHWDLDLLANFDQDLLKRVGFDPEEISKIFGLKTDEDDTDGDAEAGKIKNAKSKAGEVYQLGPHRLMCGDSTDEEQVATLMDGKLAKLIFTDPPYNVNYNYSKYRDGRKKKWDKIFNDNKKAEEFKNFITDVFHNYYKYSTDDASFYCCFAMNNYIEFRTGFEDAGWRYSQTIIWVKDRFVLALGQAFHRMYEPIFYGWKDGKSRYFNKKIANLSDIWVASREDFETELDVWYLNRDKVEDYQHPTQKPVSLAERALLKSTVGGGADIVLDLFGGSGSTLLACEQTDRICYTMELDPRYCDVIRMRYANQIGKEDWESATPVVK